MVGRPAKPSQRSKRGGVARTGPRRSRGLQAARQSRIDFPESTSAYFDYAAAGNLTAAWDDAPVETDYFVYDAADRVVARTIAGVGSLYFEYDLAGRRTMVKDWTDSAVYYDYDGRGLITRVHSDAGWTYYDFDARVSRGAQNEEALSAVREHGG